MQGFFEKLKDRNPSQVLVAAWVIDGSSAGAKALFAEEDGRPVLLFCEKPFPAELAEALPSPGTKAYMLVQTDIGHVFIERISGRKQLVICGAGHVSMPIIRIGLILNYEITVIEDREEFALRAKEAGAHHVFAEPFEKALDALPDLPGTAYIVVTRGHTHDVDCLRRILKKDFTYCGLMGSRSRTGMIREQLIEEGFPAERVEQIHMPIGLSINSRTPEEIAVSIIAQVISTFNRKAPDEGFPAEMVEEICRILKADHDVSDDIAGVLTLIIDKRQEAPRQPGTKMLVRKDGSFLGSVGGGSAEAAILEEARGMLSQGCRDCRVRTVSMKKGTMQCGGEVDVFLLPLRPVQQA